LKPASGCAEYIKSALTRLGVSSGFAWSIRAAAPAATGVAIELPLRYICLRLSTGLTPASSAGFCAMRELATACALTILLPGATRSGLTRLS